MVELKALQGSEKKAALAARVVAMRERVGCGADAGGLELGTC